jgi:hypothetical protein
MELKYIFILLALLVATGSVIAAEDGLLYTSGIINFQGGCVWNGTACPSTTVCNLTAFYPGGGTFVNNLPTTNQLTFYNATLPSTNRLGIYQAKLVCFEPTIGGGTQDFTFQVTSTGTTSGGNMTIFILLLVCALIVFVMSLLIANTYVGALSGFLLTGAGLYFTIYGIGIEANLYTNMLGFCIIGLGSVILIISTFKSVWGESNDGFSMSSDDNNDGSKFSHDSEPETVMDN